MTEHGNDVPEALVFTMIKRGCTKFLLEIGVTDGKFALGILAASFTGTEIFAVLPEQPTLLKRH